MLNQLLEVVFWLILIVYFGARFSQSMKGVKQQY